MTATTHDRQPFRHRRLRAADGTSLVLRTDGAITALAADGSVTQRWTEDDPEWPKQAIRFGVLPRTSTAKPGRPDPVTRPADR